MFKSLKGIFGGKSEQAYTVGAPAKGKAVPLSEVNDPTFADGLLGKALQSFRQRVRSMLRWMARWACCLRQSMRSA